MHKELAVVFEVRMKGKPNQALFISNAAHFVADIKKNFRRRSLHVILEDVNHAVLFNHKQTIIAGMIQMNGPVEPEFWKRVLKPHAQLLFNFVV